MDAPLPTSAAPRVLDVDLGRLAAGAPAEVRSHVDPDPARARLAAASGTALGLALLARTAEGGDDSALVVTVGECVRRGAPTAARASIAGRSPLTGGYAEGQVGTDLGRRLASVADALLLRGRAPGGGQVLVVDETGRARLQRLAGLAGTTTSAAHAALAERFGDAALVRVGPAGERGVPFASLAVGGAAPSFVGRGGLGAVFGGLGLKAVVVTAPAVASSEDEPLVQLLRTSPRLVARSTGGSFERWHAEGVRGAAEGEVDAAGGARLAGEAQARRSDTRGCSGCPTPCGWVFEARDGAPRHATYSAVRGLGPRLGLGSFEEVLELLAACDEAGVDAVETGAALEVLGRARAEGRATGPPLLGELEALVGAVRDLGAGRGAGAELGLGAEVLARRLGVDAPAPRAAGEPVAALARRVASGGPDPMRVFPFLEDAARRVSVPGLAPGDLGASEPAAVARVAAFYEDWKAAVDATGFCAFSAAGLLADGVADADRLAARIAPSGWAIPGRAIPARSGMEGVAEEGAAESLRAFGAQLVAARRALEARWGAPDPLAPRTGDAPELALALDAYAGLRGVARPPAAPSAGAPSPSPPAAAAFTASAAAGPLRLRGAGGLARALGGELELVLDAPEPLVRVLERAAEARPAAGRYLLRDGRPVPAVYRGGRRLGADETVRAGEVLDLVLALRGG